MFTTIYNSLLTLAYPQICQVCERSVEKLTDGVVCRKCWRETRIFSGEETLCVKCSAFLQAKHSEFQTFCRICDEHFYDAARAVGLYEKAIAASVLYLKREPFIAKNLKNLFISAFENSPFQDTTVIIPVPLSKKRLLERGFNQAEFLAEILAENTNLKIDKQSLMRKVHTPMHRAAMDRRARELTVENAFEVARPNFIKGEKILLVDDIFTSGATTSYCAKALKKKGADKVYVLTIARAI
jgi:competence protein ComFC